MGAQWHQYTCTLELALVQQREFVVSQFFIACVRRPVGPRGVHY